MGGSDMVGVSLSIELWAASSQERDMFCKGLLALRAVQELKKGYRQEHGKGYTNASTADVSWQASTERKRLGAPASGLTSRSTASLVTRAAPRDGRW